MYVLVSASQPRTYVGITKDLQKRTEQHNGALPGGARATRAGRPWTVERTYGPYSTRAEAQKIEYQVKRLRGRDRMHFEPDEDENS